MKLISKMASHVLPQNQNLNFFVLYAKFQSILKKCQKKWVYLVPAQGVKAKK